MLIRNPAYLKKSRSARLLTMLTKSQIRRLPKSAPVSIFFAPPRREVLDGLAAAGVSRAIFGLSPEPRDKILPRLDALAAVMR